MKFSHQSARTRPPWRVLFFGTDEFSLKTLQALNENRMVQQADKHRVVDKLDIAHPRTKKLTPVNKYADMCDLTQYEWPLHSQHQATYDVGILASFGHLIPGKVVNMFPYGILNVHPSLLPRWRGAAPLHHTILNGDTVAGVSIMAIQPKHFDIGPLITQKELEVPPRACFTSLREFMAVEGGKLIVEVLSKMPHVLSSLRPQDSDGVSYAHKVPHRTSIDWKNQTLLQVDRQYRALSETGELRTQWQGTSVRLVDMVQPGYKPCLPLDMDCPPGLPIYDKFDNLLWIRCKDEWAGFASIVVKKKMSAKAFYNGYLSKPHLKGECFHSKPNNLFDETYSKWIAHSKPS